jgi:uncharacterized protein HemY
MRLTHLDMSANVIGLALPHIGKITTLKALNLSLSTITNTSCLAGNYMRDTQHARAHTHTHDASGWASSRTL